MTVGMRSLGATTALVMGQRAAFFSSRLWAQQGKAYGRYRSACYTDTWGKANKHREKGKAKECHSGTVTG